MDDLVEGRAENAIAILENVQPDYLNLGSEPDTQAENLGQDDLNTPAGYGQFIGTIVSAIRDDCTSDTPLGAGVGTWKSNGLDFVERLVDAGVDTIDLHVYPVNYQCLLSRLDDLVILAKSCGKQAAIGEAWLQKRRDSEYTDAGVASTPEIFSRDAFDFWKPLDTQFLTSLVGFSHWRDLAYFSGFWSRYFWAYLEYAACEGMSPDDIIQQSSMAAAMGIKTGHTTDTGKAYRQAVAA
jgi:hypothetical protein